MTADSILTHSLKDITDQEISIDKFSRTENNKVTYRKSAHRRDDHYLFIFQKNGHSKIVIDFKEVELIGSVVLCILPGQVHYGVAVDNETEAWLITLDTNFVNDDYRAIFEDHYFQYDPIALSNASSFSLNKFIEIMSSIKESRKELNLIPQVIHSLINACVGMFASAYHQTENNKQNLLRTDILTEQFKRLLLRHIRTHKSTSDYAEALNISPAYLNEAVKLTTGFTVGFWIQQATMTEAKRLLYTTDITVKEIAYLLGFTDHAYFTRYFSNAAGHSPTEFRLTHRK